MEPKFGASFDHVRVHTDKQAGRLAAELHAHAFTVGEHVAFAAGRYLPGESAGDALLAHELAHVVQQRAAHPGSPGPSVQLFPAEQEEKFIGGEEAARWATAHQIMVQADPAIATATVGMTISYGLRRGYETLPPSGPPYARDWVVYEPDGNRFTTVARDDLRAHVTFRKPGTHTVAAAYRIREREFVLIYHTQEVAEATTVLDTAMKGLPKNVSATSFQAGLELRRLELEQYGLKDQSILGVPYIRSTADNPARANAGPPWEFPTYTVTPSRGASRFHWYVTPETPLDVANYHGFKRILIAGAEAYEVDATGTSARWVIFQPNVYTVVCEEFDDRGRPLGTAARYRQVVLREREWRAVEAWAEYAAEAKRHLDMLRVDSAVGVRAVHLDMTTGETTQLAIFIGPDRERPGRMKLVDLTPGVSRREYTGATVDDALAAFKSGNAYAEGFVKLEIPANDLGVTPATRTYEATGRSRAGTVSAVSGWASLGLAGLAGILALTGVGLTLAVPLLLLGSAGAGATSAAASLYDRFQQAKIEPLGVAIDIVALASSILGGATAFKMLRQSMPIMLTTRSGRFLLWANAIGGATAGVLMTVEAVGTISQVLDDERLTPGQKLDAIVRLLAVIALNAVLIGVTFADLARARTRVTSLLGSNLAAGLKAEAIYTLSLLDDDALRTLASRPKAELDEFVRVIRQNPVAAAALLRIRPFATAEELEKAIANLLESVKRPVGVFASVDVKKPPPNWRFRNVRTTEPDGTKVIRTDVEYTDPTGRVRRGHFVRAYNPKTKAMEMREAYRGTLPGKVTHPGAMLTPTGTPTVHYMTLYQAKVLGVAYESLATVTMKNIENFETIFELAWLRKKYPSKSIDDLILNTSSVKYAKTSIIQAGSEITGAHVDPKTGKSGKISELLDQYVASDERNIRRSFGDMIRVRAEQDALLSKFGLKRDDVMLYGFDIQLEVRSFSGEAPGPGPAPAGTSAVPPK